MKIVARLRRVALGILAAVLAGSACGQADYPAKPVRVIANSAPGASIDITARLTADWLSRRLKQNFVVENRPGGGGTIGADVVVKSPPDGHVLLVGSHGISYQSSFFKDTPYDWQKDIAPVAKIAGSGYAMMVHSSVPAKTLADFVAWVKANPGKLNHGLAGSYTPEMEDMKSKMGVTGLIVHVMYKGGAPLTQAITVGEVHLMFGGVFQAVPLAQSGKIRILAYTGHARHAAMPDVPTSAEAGFPGAEGGFWLGMYAPAATPVPVIARLNAEINAMNRDPATLEIYRKQGYETWTVTPAQMRAEMLDLQKNAASVVKLLGIKPE